MKESINKLLLPLMEESNFIKLIINLIGKKYWPVHTLASELPWTFLRDGHPYLVSHSYPASVACCNKSNHSA